MRKRRKKTIAKLGLLFVIILLSLAGISMSYAAWTDTITIEGTVTTGTWIVNESAWARMNDNPGDFIHPFPGSNWATYIKCIPDETIQTFYLYADQEYRVGELYVSKDSSYLYVEYYLDDGYDMSVSHLHVATSLDGIPQTPSGNPKIGNFEYNGEHDPRVTEYTYTMPWDSAWDGIDLYIAAHADVWGIYS